MFNDPLEQSLTNADLDNNNTLHEYADLSSEDAVSDPAPAADQLVADECRIVYNAPRVNDVPLGNDVIITVKPQKGGLTALQVQTRKDRVLTQRFSAVIDINNTDSILTLLHFQKLTNELVSELLKRGNEPMRHSLKTEELQGKMIAEAEEMRHSLTAKVFENGGGYVFEDLTSRLRDMLGK